MSLPKVITEGRQSLTKAVGAVLKTPKDLVAVEKRLATNLLHQMGNEWCWASVAACIADAYHDGPTGQCQIASAVFSTPAKNRQCCSNGIDAECDVPQPLSSALKVNGNYVRYHDRVDDKGAPFDFPFVKSFIDGHRPLPAHISYRTTGHYVVITGYRVEPGAKFVFVRDPANVDNVLSAVDFTHFLNAYKFRGKWDGSYETQQGAQPPSKA